MLDAEKQSYSGYMNYALSRPQKSKNQVGPDPPVVSFIPPPIYTSGHPSKHSRSRNPNVYHDETYIIVLKYWSDQKIIEN